MQWTGKPCRTDGCQEARPAPQDDAREDGEVVESACTTPEEFQTSGGLPVSSEGTQPLGETFTIAAEGAQHAGLGIRSCPEGQSRGCARGLAPEVQITGIDLHGCSVSQGGAESGGHPSSRDLLTEHAGAKRGHGTGSAMGEDEQLIEDSGKPVACEGVETILTNGPGGGRSLTCPSRRASTPGRGGADVIRNIEDTSLPFSRAATPRGDEDQVQVSDSSAGDGEVSPGRIASRTENIEQPGEEEGGRLASGTCTQEDTALGGRFDEHFFWQTFNEEMAALEHLQEAAGCEEGQGRRKVGLEVEVEDERQVGQEGQAEVTHSADVYSTSACGRFAPASQSSWHSLCGSAASSFGGPLSRVGIYLLAALLTSPFQLGEASRLQLHTWYENRTPRKDAYLKGDLLPLPLGMSVEDLAVVKIFAADHGTLQLDEREELRHGAESWLVCTTLVLNGMWAEPQSFNLRDSEEEVWPGFVHHVRQPNQTEAIRLLRERISAFLLDESGAVVRTVPNCWDEELKRKKIDYTGHVVSKAVSFTWAQLEPGLPKVGQAARVDVMDLAEGEMRRILEHPRTVLRPKSDWPAKFNNTKVLAASDEDWDLFCIGMYKRGLIRCLKRSELLFDSTGRRLDSCCFGVGTGKQVIDPESQAKLDVLRAVFNLPPANELQFQVDGDVATLPYHGSWQGLVLGDPDVFHWFSDDMVSSFFLFRLPEPWAGVFALEREARGYTVGSTADFEVVGLTVVPPGWLSANGVIQYLHRRLVAKASVLPPSLELRKDRPRPTDGNFMTPSFYSVYVDNLDGAAIDRGSGDSDVETWFIVCRHTGEQLGVVYHDGDKAVKFGLLGKTLGGEIRSAVKSSRPIVSKVTNVVGETFWVMSCDLPHLKDIEMLSGSWVHLIQFARQMMGAVTDLWGVIHGDVSLDERWKFVSTDYLKLLSLVPLAVSAWSQDIDEVVTCSDASENGGGVCRSTGLTELGLKRLREAELLRSVPPSDGLLLIDAFAGISAARRSLQLLGITPGSFVSYDVDEQASSVVRRAFPQVRELGDITKATSEELKQAVADNPHITHVLLVGGSPCQDVSSANPDGAGLSGSKSSLFYSYLRLRDVLVPSVFPNAVVAEVLENVASMSNETRDLISMHLGYQPVKCCPSDLWPVQRPRYYWLNFDLADTLALSVTQKASYRLVTLLGDRLDVSEFLPAGTRVASTFTSFPTFLRARPRRTEPYKPIGIGDCTPSELSLWKQNDYKFAPYQFRLRNLIFNVKRQEWLVPPAELREKLMLFRPDYTWLKVGKAKNLTQSEHEDARMSLLGDSIHAGVLSALLNPLLRTWKFLDVVYPPATFASAAETKIGSDGSSAELRLVRAYFSYQDHRGGALLLESGQSRLSSRPTGQPLDARQWRWKSVLSCRWQIEGDHINALESRALLLSLRWRTRSVARFSRRFLHLTDSRVALGSFMKHRTNSRSFNYIVSRSSALQLAASVTPVLAYVRTDRNPADLPSRRFLTFRPRAVLKTLGTKRPVTK
jgi:hypothetical protein